MAKQSKAAEEYQVMENIYDGYTEATLKEEVLRLFDMIQDTKENKSAQVKSYNESLKDFKARLKYCAEKIHYLKSAAATEAVLSGTNQD